jgi:hypothetical protein
MTYPTQMRNRQKIDKLRRIETRAPIQMQYFFSWGMRCTIFNGLPGARDAAITEASLLETHLSARQPLCISPTWAGSSHPTLTMAILS